VAVVRVAVFQVAVFLEPFLLPLPQVIVLRFKPPDFK